MHLPPRWPWGPPRRHWRAAGWAVVALLAAGAAAALPPAMVRDRWGLEQGLPQSSVTAILQAHDGYLWIGTFGGLVRFDGVRFREYGPATAPGLATGRILSLAEGADGRLFVGTEDGGLFALEGEAVRRLAGRPELPSDQVPALLADADGALWVGTLGGLARLAQGRVERVLGEADGLPSNQVKCLAREPSGALWIGTRAGLARLTASGVENWATKDPLLAQGILGLAIGGEGELWAYAEGHLLRLREGAVEARPLPAPPSGPFVGALVRDGRGELWLGRQNLHHTLGGELVLAGTAEEFGGRNLRALFEDRERSLWVGTDGGGLVRFRRGRASTLDAEFGVPDGSVTVVTEDAAGRMWVGTLCRGLARWEGERFAAVGKPDGTPFGCVNSLLAEPDGSLWVGEDGLFRLRDGSLERYGLEQGLPSNVVRALVRSRDGALWIGTARGLARLEGERIEVYDASRGLVDDRVQALAELSDGSLWVGTANGASRLAGGTFHNLTGRQGLPAGSVRAIREGPDGEVWLGTYGGGLVRVLGERLEVLTTAQGLADNVVSAILADEAGRLWLSGNRGISRVEREQLLAVLAGREKRVVPLVLGSGDGLHSAECNGGYQPAGWRSRDGRLWFPTVAGLAMVEPGAWRPIEAPPPVAIEEVLAAGVARPGHGPVEVRPPRRDLEVRFTALTFVHPEQARFRYRLAGFDPGWVEAGTRRVAYYTNLPAGRYRFEVLAANADGVWSERPAAVEVVAHPRFWETAWFRVLAALALVCLGACAYRLRVWRLHAREQALERTVALRTAELAAANERDQQHLVVLRRQEAELRELNENLSGLVRQQTRALEQTRDAAILTLARLAELRDGTTGAHLERIAAYCRCLSAALAGGPYGPLPDDYIEQLARSSPLHDIGKVAIPDAILRKAGPLTAEEREVMRSHTIIGGDTLRSVLERYESQDYLTMAMHIAYSHHERWDGDGYPRRLREAEIPLSARIVTLADVYDALTSERPYKAAYAHERAVEEILQERGTRFDPHLVDAFREVADEFPRLRARLTG